MTNALKKLAELIKGNTKSTGSDYTAKVTRVEGNTAYVQLTGAEITDTPVALTINAKEGDMVRVRVNNGKAWITGNDDAPPTDNQAANEAKQVAIYAQTQAGSANNAAAEAMQSANNARASANAAAAAAAEAQGSARTANQAANNALSGLSTLEHVIDTVNWFAEHKKASTDTTVNVNKTYYIYDAVAGTLSAVEPEGTENPSQEGWYELDEAIANYVITHVATTEDGLSVVGLANGWRALISTGQGSYDPGIYLINPDGDAVSEFREIVKVGKDAGAHLLMTDTLLRGENANGGKTFEITSEGTSAPIEYFNYAGWQVTIIAGNLNASGVFHISDILGDGWQNSAVSQIANLYLKHGIIETFDDEMSGLIQARYGRSQSFTISNSTLRLETIVSYDGDDTITINCVSATSYQYDIGCRIDYITSVRQTTVSKFLFGNGTVDGPFAFVIGEGTDGKSNQFVAGRYNKPDNSQAVIIGNGNALNRSNALELDWNGNLEVAGEITFGGKKVLLDTPFKQMKVAQQTANNRPLILSFELESGYYDVQQVVFTNIGLEYYGKNRSTQSWERIW